MISGTLVIIILELVGLFAVGIGISWIGFKALNVASTRTPIREQGRTEQTQEIRLDIEKTRLDVQRLRKRTEEMKLRALQTRAEVVGGHEIYDHNNRVDNP